MSKSIPFSVSAHVALRAKLAAFMVLALLVTGIFNLRVSPTDANRSSGQAQGTYLIGTQPIRHRNSNASTSPGSQLATGNRLRHAGRRSPRYEEIHQSAQAIGWPDLEKGAPTTPRFFFRKIPASEGSDSDADAPHAPSSGYNSRAPPATA